MSPAAALTRYTIQASDPITLAAFRFGIGFIPIPRALALSVLPLTTMLVAALLGREALSWRKSIGVLIAIGGVALGIWIASVNRAQAPQ